MTLGAPSYKGFRFPVEIISHGVWLYHRFPLSFREIEEMRRASATSRVGLAAATSETFPLVGMSHTLLRRGRRSAEGGGYGVSPVGAAAGAGFVIIILPGSPTTLGPARTHHPAMITSVRAGEERGVLRQSGVLPARTAGLGEGQLIPLT